MKKFISMLSIVAVAASALFVSCAEKKEPDLVPAFPSNKFASYLFNEEKGEHLWSFESVYKYTNANGGGFVAPTPANNPIMEYRLTPNHDWTAEVTGSDKAYIEIGTGYGWSDENYTYGSSASGSRGLNSIYFKVIKTPEHYEGDVECKVYLHMGGETMVIATLTIGAKPEPAAPAPTPDYTIDTTNYVGSIVNYGDTGYDTNTFVIELSSTVTDESTTRGSLVKVLAIEYNLSYDVTDGASAQLLPVTDEDYAANTFLPGYFTDWYYGTIYVEMNPDTEEFYVTEPVNGGEVSVAVADGVYTIKGNLTTESGKIIAVDFVGELDGSADLSLLHTRKAKK